FTSYSSNPIGNYKDIHSCQATDQRFLENGTDGGVVNSIINFLIEEKLIDGSIVSKTDAPFHREAIFANNKEDLLDASGAKLDVTPQLQEIQKFCTYTHSIPELNHYKFKRLAVVGTPCQLYTIRCMQDLGVTPSENIEICLGLFCYENFFFDKSQIKKFEKDFNITFKDIVKINIKEDVIFNLKNKGNGEKTVHVPFNHLTDYMRPACNACSDFTNIYADISFGGLASPSKYTTVITRTEKGKEIFAKAVNAGVIKCSDLEPSKKENMIELIAHFSQSKIERKEKFMKKIT
ncbi:MAG: hypothetical protein GF383_07170, partial [Candidatus Lokiarchaeota archaeon]|nr:hypothetical protein [Candidatus Lokiarchaeota archaeon]MBD3339948.1 hypothetical protein [Candidatus Lokiarchaeota archaeon]